MSEQTNHEKFLEAMHSLDEAVQEDMANFSKESEEFWNSLSKEQQLMAFHHVFKLTNHGLKQNVSYRGILYGLFGFAPDAYTVGMECGFFNIYNNWSNDPPKGS